MSQLLVRKPIVFKDPVSSDAATSFQVMQQFVVAPDRRYQVTLDDDTLHFVKTGSQFDAEWAARGAKTRIDPKVATWLKQISPKKLFVVGTAMATIGLALLLFLGGMALYGDVTYSISKMLTSVGVLFLAMIFGIVMIIAGISGRRGNSGSGHRHNFSLFQTEIASAELLSPQSELARRGEPQVARVHLRLHCGKTLKLALPKQGDLIALKSSLPGLLED